MQVFKLVLELFHLGFLWRLQFLGVYLTLCDNLLLTQNDDDLDYWSNNLQCGKCCGMTQWTQLMTKSLMWIMITFDFPHKPWNSNQPADNRGQKIIIMNNGTRGFGNELIPKLQKVVLESSQLRCARINRIISSALITGVSLCNITYLAYTPGYSPCP